MLLFSQVEVNTIGDFDARASFKEELQKWFKQEKVSKHLSNEDKKKAESNPLRLLDSKTFPPEGLQEEIPRMDQFLSSESKESFRTILDALDGLGIQYKLNPYLVRGLDYYNDFCFEVKPIIDGATKQSTLLAGGRYDLLLGSIAKDPRKSFKAVGLENSYTQVCHGN
jgi:histidyl-tRNA synthetase